MRVKHRSVGPQSPFHPSNVPPDQYVIPEVILEKPCKLDHHGVDTRKIPYSGKLGTLGHKILADFKKAKYLTQGDWQEAQFQQQSKHKVTFTSRFKKPAKDVTSKLTLRNFVHDPSVRYTDSNFA